MKMGNSAILPSALNWPVVVAVAIAVVEAASITAALFTGSIA
jgi:hypothetical protein